MSLEKLKIVDLVEVPENGHVHVRTALRILDNGEVISQSFHRHVIAPGECTEVEDLKVQAICAAVHTDDVVAAYKLAQESQIPA